MSHPKIDDVAVIGVPNEYAGELPRAHVVLESGANLTEEEVKNFLASNYAKFIFIYTYCNNYSNFLENVVQYKRLEGGVKFVDSIPKSASGKILRRLIKQQAIVESKSSKL